MVFYYPNSVVNNPNMGNLKMKRTPLDALITQKTLEFMSSRSDFLLDLVVDHHEADLPVQIKNVCTKVAAPLADEIDEVCGMLGVSKRSFLEAAFIEAVIKAKAIMEAEGLDDYIEEMAQEQKKARVKEAS